MADVKVTTIQVIDYFAGAPLEIAREVLALSQETLNRRAAKGAAIKAAVKKSHHKKKPAGDQAAPTAE